MSKQQMLLGIALYLLLSRIDSNEQSGKTGRKNLLKALKKPLAIEGNKDPKPYLALVNASEGISDKAKAEFTREQLRINPGAIIKFTVWRYPELMDMFGLKQQHIENLYQAYDTTLMWNSVKVSNRIVTQIEIYVKELEDERSA